MRSIGIVLGIALFSFSVSAFPETISKEKFDAILKLIKAEQFDSAHTHIDSLRKTSPDDPELLSLLANYYYAKSLSSVLVISPGVPPNEAMMTLHDSSGDTAGYMADSLVINEDTLQASFAAMKEGIRKFPQRIDFHIGLITTAMDFQHYRDMMEAAVQLLELSTKNSVWFGPFSQPAQSDANTSILDNVQYCATTLFNNPSTANDSLFTIISEKMILHYPRSVYGHTNLGILALANKNYTKAVPHLMTALAIDSTDTIVLFNLGHAYGGMGDKEKAKAWYEKIIAIGSEQDRDFARKKIEELK